MYETYIQWAYKYNYILDVFIKLNVDMEMKLICMFMPKYWNGIAEYKLLISYYPSYFKKYWIVLSF